MKARESFHASRLLEDVSDCLREEPPVERVTSSEGLNCPDLRRERRCCCTVDEVAMTFLLNVSEGARWGAQLVLPVFDAMENRPGQPPGGMSGHFARRALPCFAELLGVDASHVLEREKACALQRAEEDLMRQIEVKENVHDVVLPVDAEIPGVPEIDVSCEDALEEVCPSDAASVWSLREGFREDLSKRAWRRGSELKGRAYAAPHEPHHGWVAEWVYVREESDECGVFVSM
jgi:hypothetical protein